MTRKCKEETEKISEIKTLKGKTPYTINDNERIKNNSWTYIGTAPP